MLMSAKTALLPEGTVLFRHTKLDTETHRDTQRHTEFGFFFDALSIDSFFVSLLKKEHTITMDNNYVLIND